jgi:hypothetical protein
MDPVIVKRISGFFAPNSMTNLKVKGKDVAVKSDAEGNAVQAFIGKLSDNGNIKGERFARTFIKDKDGKIIKDHWDLKGKAS